MPVPFVGPSYTLDVRGADCQRTVNMFPAIVESGTGKSGAILQSIPGLSLFVALGAEIRGFKKTASRCFVVAGSALYEIDSAGTATSRGTLLTSTGPVSIDAGLNQLVLVDGPYGYVLTLATNVFARITSASFYGSDVVRFIGGFFVFLRPDTQQFYISAIDDATTLDALDFASAESSPDKLVSLLVDHGDVLLFGEETTEPWLLTGDADFPFQANSRSRMEVGIVGPFAAQKLDSTFFWVGRDENGEAQVWMANGYRPQRISTHAVEQALQRSTDLASTTTYAYQQDGFSFFAINAPGLDTTLVYEVTSQSWHDRAELVNGEYTQHRARHHCYAFGKHLVGGEDGNVYWLDKTVNNNYGDVLVRDRVSPHNATPGLDHQFFSRFTLDCTVGKGKPDGSEALVMFRYAGGVTDNEEPEWSNWRTASLGNIGERRKRVFFTRLGRSIDRIWMVRCTDDVAFSIINAVIE